MKKLLFVSHFMSYVVLSNCECSTIQSCTYTHTLYYIQNNNSIRFQHKKWDIHMVRCEIFLLRTFARWPNVTLPPLPSPHHPPLCKSITLNPVPVSGYWLSRHQPRLRISVQTVILFSFWSTGNIAVVIGGDVIDLKSPEIAWKDGEPQTETRTEAGL